MGIFWHEFFEVGKSSNEVVEVKLSNMNLKQTFQQAEKENRSGFKEQNKPLKLDKDPRKILILVSLHFAL